MKSTLYVIQGKYLLLFIIFVPCFVSCSKSPPQASLPNPSKTLAISIVLLDSGSGQIVSRCTVKNRENIQHIYECLVPNELVTYEKSMVYHGLIIGKLGFLTSKGTTWVEFIDPGMNPLSFRVGEDEYIRGGTAYREYRSDHKKLYGIDSDRVAEGKVFYDKLINICNSHK